VCLSNDLEDEYNGHTIEWVLDSGCGHHLTGDASLLSGDTSSTTNSLYLPDDSTAQSTKRGTVSLKPTVAGIANKVDVTDVKLVPGLTKNLLSYVRLKRNGVRLVYEGKKRY
jgi:hypothetical protein